MKQGKEFKIKNIVLCLCTLVLTSLSADAVSNSLTGIDVKHNPKDGYNVILKLAKNTKIKKTINSADTITLVLNSTVPSDAMEIIYDNTSSVNNVIVQKKNTENTMVVLEGKNISNANIYTKDISTGAINPLNSDKSFLGINKKLLTFSTSIMFIWILFMLLFKTKKRKADINNKSVKNRIIGNTLRTSNINHSKTTPSISYNISSGYNSVPRDFVINRYLEDEKIRKAG